MLPHLVFKTKAGLKERASLCTFYIWKNDQEVSFHFHGQTRSQAIIIFNTNNLECR